MTPEEAIEILEEVKELDDTMYAYSPAYMNALDMAISSLKGIQQYREIGTVEECKEMAVIANKKTNPDELAKIIVEWIQYNKIGTVEECREAVEKQKPKKPHRNYKKFSGLWCKCGWYLGQKQCLDIKYCPNCGQAIDENLEGMEDE